MLALKIPPVVLVILFTLLMFALDKVVSFSMLNQSISITIALCCSVLGTLIALAGVKTFKRAQTTVNPMKPEQSSELVTHGVYSRTRNPMYLGFLCWLIAWGILLNNAYTLVLCAGFVLYMNQFQIKPEERALSEIFGEQFTLYTSTMRRWL